MLKFIGRLLLGFTAFQANVIGVLLVVALIGSFFTWDIKYLVEIVDILKGGKSFILHRVLLIIGICVAFIFATPDRSSKLEKIKENE